MKICFLSSTHSLSDKRVFEKEAVYLAKAGFHVVHLAPGDGATAYKKNVELVTFQRKRGLRGRLLLLPRLYRRAVEIEADCYHCNEVDSWLIGVFLMIASFGLLGVVFGNILQSARGLFSIILGVFVAYAGFEALEPKITKKILIQRMLAAVLMAGAVTLFLL